MAWITGSCHRRSFPGQYVCFMLEKNSGSHTGALDPLCYELCSFSPESQLPEREDEVSSLLEESKLGLCV